MHASEASPRLLPRRDRATIRTRRGFVAGIARFPSTASSLTEKLCVGTISRNVHSGPEVFNAGKVALQGGATLGDVKVRRNDMPTGQRLATEFCRNTIFRRIV